MEIFTEYPKAREFIDKITTVSLLRLYGNKYGLKISCDYSVEDLAEGEFKVITYSNGLKGTLYYKKHNIGIYEYGLNGEDQWWSSRCSVINDVFGTNITECVINNMAYGIDMELEEFIIEQFNLKK